MQHSTPQRKHPLPETLLYLSTFARAYATKPDNETTARMLAQQVAYGKTKGCWVATPHFII